MHYYETTPTEEGKVSAILSLSYSPEAAGRPVMCDLAKKFEVTFNILKARFSIRKEGHLVVEFTGEKSEFDKGVAFLKNQGITVNKVSQKISRDEESCLHCGVCTALCATGALWIEPETRKVCFDSDKCSACGLCTRICPVKAMHVEEEDILT
jgi:ferredoxin